MRFRGIAITVLPVALALFALPRSPFELSARAQSASDAGAQDGVRKAADGFYVALNRMFTGDAAPILAVWSHSDDVTDMGPLGNRRVGWDQVRAEFEHEAKLKLGGKVEPRDMLVRAGQELGYVVCTEHGENLGAHGKPVNIVIRSTSIFRLEAGTWKLVHHHTDLAPELGASAPR
jgi:ketosteroid isomerase-like protein